MRLRRLFGWLMTLAVATAALGGWFWLAPIWVLPEASGRAGPLPTAGRTASPALTAPANPVFRLGPHLQKGIFVGLVADPDLRSRPALLAYLQVLQEEGFPYRLLSPADLDHDKLTPNCQALIIAEEGIEDFSAITPLALNQLTKWLEQGGKLLVVGGTKIAEAKELLALCGLKATSSTPFLGPWIIPADSPLRSQFDFGLYHGDRLRTVGYPDDQTYHTPLAMLETSPPQVLAWTEAPSTPLVTLRPCPAGQLGSASPAQGKAMLVNAPLGALKATANSDYLIRVPLKFFLIQVARVPHLVAAPGGVGGLVLNFHICTWSSMRALKKLISEQALAGVQGLPLTISVTAGPDSLLVGDHLGVDAKGRGRPYLEEVAAYGSLGCQGGWMHSFWGLFLPKLSSPVKRKLIDLNFTTMEKLRGGPVTEYAAPYGAHDAEVNDYLASWGVKGAAFPAAFNSPPTHCWSKGKLEPRFWLFPYTATQDGSCPENMLDRGRRPDEIAAAIRAIADIAKNRQEIRLFYFHAISWALHPEIWNHTFPYLKQLVAARELTVRTMADYADFLNRMQEVHFSLERIPRASEASPGSYSPEAHPREYSYRITAQSPASLREQTWALPLPLWPAGTRATLGPVWELRLTNLGTEGRPQGNFSQLVHLGPKETQGMSVQLGWSRFWLRCSAGWVYLTVDQDLRQVNLRVDLRPVDLRPTSLN